MALGLEHSVANMFLVPLGMLCGAEISAGEFWLNNMLPVVAGNAVGAGKFTSNLPLLVIDGWILRDCV